MTNPIKSSTSSSFETPRTSQGRGHGRVTLADVAVQAGVTTMTISRFLRSPKRVAVSTAKIIAAALEQTGYSPNLQAGSLASGRSHAVAVVVPNIAHSIFADTLHGLGQGLQNAGLHMLVSSTGYSLAQEELEVRTVLGWAPAAMVVTGRMHLPPTKQLLLAAQKRGTPVVEIWDQSPEDEPHDFYQIGLSHRKAGATMAQALIERGYSRLAFMDSGVEGDIRAHERAEGFIDHALSCSIQTLLLVPAAGDPIEQGGVCFAAWHASSIQAAQRHETLGIGFANDLLGTGALLQAHRLDCRIPQEIGLLGFGDFPVARYCQGGLSTLRIDGEGMGLACAHLIAQHLQKIGDDALNMPSQQLIQPSLHWRGLDKD